MHYNFNRSSFATSLLKTPPRDILFCSNEVPAHLLLTDGLGGVDVARVTAVELGLFL